MTRKVYFNLNPSFKSKIPCMFHDDPIPHYLVKVIKKGVLLWGSDMYVEILRMRRVSHANRNEVRRRRKKNACVCACVYACMCAVCAKVLG